MPGIHLRTLGRLNWETHVKEPTLVAVPGSYWLCRKNKIYKFSFKFHEPISATAADFSHSKELMKIVRRVLKWQPRQGQQFSTKNLLVTYNHVPWTHVEERTFAVTKFSDRPAAVAFTHAFVLTVKLLNLEETKSSEKIMGGSSTKSVAKSPTLQDSTEENSCPVASPESNGKNNVQEKIETVDSVTTTNGHLEPENTKDKDLSRSLRTRSRLKDENHDASMNSPKSSAARAESLTIKIAEVADSSSNVKQMDSDSQDKSAELTNGELQQSREVDVAEKGEEEDEEDNDTLSECADLPYQYLIERDIERELQNSRVAKENDSASANVPADLCDSSLNVDGDTKSSKESRKSNSSSKSPKSKQESRDNDSAAPDVTTLKSSDITDLVMKGLMFTIRQDEDTVTVVEQKTKLEVDEVLENSEKVERKEGDACLINSSLLRLEKMVTRIPTSPLSSSQKPNGSNNNSLVAFVDLASEIDIENEKRLSVADKSKRSESTRDAERNWSQLFSQNQVPTTTPKSVENTLGNSSSMYQSDENTDEEMELKIDDDDEEEEEEEDIIPEALMNSNFFNNSLNASYKISKDSSEDLLTKNSAADDNDGKMEEEIDVITDHQPDVFPLNGASVNKDLSLRLPKVISNEIITNDQIPVGILKVIRNKSPNLQTTHTKELDYEKDNTSSMTNKSKNSITPDSEAKTATYNGDTVRNNNESDFKSIEKTKPLVENLSIRDKEKYASLDNTTIDNQHVHVGSPSKTTQDGLKFKRNTRATTNSDSSDCGSLDSVRLTRSNAKLQSKHTETSNSTPTKSKTHSVEARLSLRSLERPSQIQQINNTPIDKITRSRKRKRSESNQDTSDIVNNKKSEKKQVTKKMARTCHLVHHLTYGLRVVVERIDMKNFQR